VGDEAAAKEVDTETADAELASEGKVAQAYTCDRCGAAMIESNCKVFCRNCGHRFDCSDLNIYFD
jgi:uncharacterized Zn finger protein (UPF0148 family)